MLSCGAALCNSQIDHPAAIACEYRIILDIGCVEILIRPLLSLGVTSRMSMGNVSKLARVAEDADVHGIWIGEDISRGSDVFVVASVTMRKAPSKNIGIGITSPLVHNISTIARAAGALSEIDPAKFRLGLGMGGLHDLARLGVRVERPVAVLRNAVKVLRCIWAGETLTLKGEFIDVHQFAARYKPEGTIPIYLGVRGPKLLQLASLVADGVILSGPISYIEKAIKTVRTAASSGNLRSSPRIVVWLPTLLIRKKSDRRMARAVAATVIADTPQGVMQMAAIPHEAVQHVQKVTKECGYVAASKWVTEELLDSFTISGDARHITYVFESLAEMGAEEVVFGPPYGSHPVRSLREVVKAWDHV